MSISDNNPNKPIDLDDMQPIAGQTRIAADNDWRSFPGCTSSHAICWSAVIAGTLAAAALTLLLTILGAGLGMSSVSVWSGEGIGAKGLGISAIVWLAFTQIAASGLGGFYAGRFNVQERVLPAKEALYRDTANGFLTWALATFMTAWLVSALAGSILGVAAKGASLTDSVELSSGAKMQMLAAGASNMRASGSDTSDDTDRAMRDDQNLHYMVSSLFRGQPAASDKNGQAAQSPTANQQNQQQIEEVLIIVASNLNEAALPVEDMRYIAGLVSKRTGISQAEAEDRVATTFTHIKQKRATLYEEMKAATEKARKVAAASAFWFFVFLLLGAISASVAAVWGGKCRDTAD